MNRSKKAMLNISSQLLLQLVTAICGFIVPKLILDSFGSETNGIVASISQFLGVISLMESGFASVAKSAFFKPLAKNDHAGISGVYNATESFFHKVAYVFLAYCVGLAFVFPFIRENSLGYWLTVLLVLIVGINSFMQYYLGISYTVLLNADQRGYFSTFAQIITIVLNAFMTVLLLRWGASIHIVKLVSAAVFILKPIVVNLYGRYRYRIDKHCPPNQKSVAQKWDNLGQSVALYVHTKTDYIITTIFLSFSDVSIYSVYSLVTTSLSAIISSISTGFVSGLGNMYAGGEKENFNKVFSLYTFLNTLASFSFYAIAFVLLLPFVRIYTANLTDANYIRPWFGAALIVAELIYCLRLPYYYMATNAGHFKNIKRGAYLEAGINIVLSLILVHFLGILGLAIATLVAMTFRTVEIILYSSKHILEHSPLVALKRTLVNLGGAALAVFLSSLIPYQATSFLTWFILAIMVAAVVVAVMCVVNFIFYRKDFALFFQKIKSVLKR